MKHQRNQQKFLQFLTCTVHPAHGKKLSTITSNWSLSLLPQWRSDHGICLVKDWLTNGDAELLLYRSAHYLGPKEGAPSSPMCRMRVMPNFLSFKDSLSVQFVALYNQGLPFHTGKLSPVCLFASLYSLTLETSPPQNMVFRALCALGDIFRRRRGDFVLGCAHIWRSTPNTAKHLPE